MEPGQGPPPEQLSDGELAARLRQEAQTVRPGYAIEQEAPVDLEPLGADVDIDGVDE